MWFTCREMLRAGRVRGFGALSGYGQLICTPGPLAAKSCKDVDECVLWVVTRLVSGICHNDWRVLVRLSKRIRERGGGWQAALSNRDVRRGTDREPCLQERSLTNYRMDAHHATRGTRGTPVQGGVLDATTEWTLSCELVELSERGQ